MKNIHKDNDLYLMPGADLNKMIAITKLLLKLKPGLNAVMMDWLGYLHDINPQDNDDWHDNDDWDDFPFGVNDDFVNQDGSVEHDGLDDLMWKMGLSLPGWDDLKKDDNSNGDNDEE
tara:strand:- start:494 stop:844 length:351 start_codon:yes stop_codon:yes gene_type:complete